MPGRVLITGASGFVGSHLARDFYGRGIPLRLAGRQPGLAAGLGIGDVPEFTHGDLAGTVDWRPALDDVSVVVHAAGFAHASDQDIRHEQINHEATLSLARQAADAGVKRLIFLSSIKVNGECSEPGRPFTAEDPPRPQGAYAEAKYRAEQALQALSLASSLEVVIVRPCLVYGPGVKANFRQLLTVVARGLPLPLASIDNRRSYLAIQNLADLVAVCLTHPAAAGQTLLASDGEDLSTPELVRRLAMALGVPGRLFPVPLPLLRLGAGLLGQGDRLESLVDWLQVDSFHTQTLLNWRAPVSLEAALRETVDSFRFGQSSGKT